MSLAAPLSKNNYGKYLQNLLLEKDDNVIPLRMAS